MRRKVKYFTCDHKQQQSKQHGFSIFYYVQAFYFTLLSQVQIAEPRAITSIVVGSIYFALTRSTTVYLLLACFLITAAIKVAVDSFPKIGIKIKPWHLLCSSLAMTAVLAWEAPASAQFFDALEQAVNDVASEGDTGIDEGSISTIFAFFRIIIILAFLAGAAVVLTRAFQGNDWGPIANMLGVGVAFVIVVELITNLMLGETGSGGGGIPGTDET